MEKFLAEHWDMVALIGIYVGLTCLNQLPPEWKGWYFYIHAVAKSLAASAPVQVLESKYNITSADGSSVTETKTATLPQEPKP